MVKETYRYCDYAFTFIISLLTKYKISLFCFLRFLKFFTSIKKGNMDKINISDDEIKQYLKEHLDEKDLKELQNEL